MSEQDQIDERRPLLQAAPAGAEPPSAMSLDALQRLLGSQLSQANLTLLIPSYSGPTLYIWTPYYLIKAGLYKLQILQGIRYTLQTQGL